MTSTTTDRQSEQSTAPEPEAAPAAPRGVRPRWVALLAVALAASLAAGGWLLLERREAHRLESAHDGALAQARESAEALTTYHHERLDEDFAAVQDGAVDPFAEQFEKAGASLRKVLEQYDGTASGKVVRAAVVSGDEDRAEVILFVDQTVTSAMQKKPRLDRNRIAMTMVHTDDGWKVSEAELL
jgi:Mce-associated membrane protein